MRVCSTGTTYTCTITDNQSSGKDGKPAILTLFYRLPTTEERQQYINEMIVRDGDVLVKQATATRIKFGAQILTGIGAGSFGRVNKQGKIIPISSEKGSPDFFEGWREELMEGAGDILFELAAAVFERSIQRAQLKADAEKN